MADQNQLLDLSELQNHDEIWHAAKVKRIRKGAELFQFDCSHFHGKMPHKRHTIIFHLFKKHHGEYFDEHDKIVVDSGAHCRYVTG
eukprot:316776_1